MDIVSMSIKNINTAGYTEANTVCKNQAGDKTFMVVIIIDNTKEDIGFKVMDEDCGPQYCNAPKYQQKQLTPTKNELALHWRKKTFGVK